MSKPQKGIKAWLGDVFGSSHKAISENLSTEEYNQLVIDAEKFRAGEGSSDDSDDDDDAPDPEPKNEDPTNTTIESRVQALEASLTGAQSALKAEKKISKGLQAKLTETETKLTASAEQNKKLRDAVNPLGDDLSDTETKDTHLTKADIQARESYKKNRSEE